MKYYIAGPMFNQEEQDAVAQVAEKLRKAGHEAYVPMEHSIENGWKMSNNLWANKNFVNDIEAIQAADAVIALVSGIKDDAGTCWEIGYSYGIGKRVYLIPKDTNVTYSLMVCQSASLIIHQKKGLIDKEEIDQS